MASAFGILLFVLTYGTVAYMVYDEVSGRRSRRRAAGARRTRLPRLRTRTGRVEDIAVAAAAQQSSIRADRI